MFFGSGVAGLSVPYPHSTHDCLHFTLGSPPSPRLHSPMVGGVPHDCLFVLTQESRLLLTLARIRRPVVAFFPLVQRPASCSLAALPSHAARKGATYRWTFTFSTERNRVFFPVFCGLVQVPSRTDRWSHFCMP